MAEINQSNQSESISFNLNQSRLNYGIQFDFFNLMKWRLIDLLFDWWLPLKPANIITLNPLITYSDPEIVVTSELDVAYLTG